MPETAVARSVRLLTRRPARTAALAALAVLACLVPTATAAVPAGYTESTVITGLDDPTALRFSPDGRVFVAEKSGRILVYDGLGDATPTVFADLSRNVHNFWDRGLLGFTLAPNFPADPSVYVLYTHDAAIGGTAPRWGTGALSDGCPTPPGATADGCVVSGRLSRLTASGNTMTGSEQVLIEDWCQQYPSHSQGSLEFGSDGALYVSSGDGASWNFADWGQDGNPLNPCGDPPGGAGAVLSPPTAEGGSLRAQDLRTPLDPTSLDGAILRVDPATGEGLPSNPLGLSSDPNARRIVAHGMRNPFRLTIRPGTNEVWAADVGWNSWEEINRISSPTDGTVDNYGWPCFEGPERVSAFDSANLNLCENLYNAGSGAVSASYFVYDHGESVVPGQPCKDGSSSISGMDFYDGGSFPDHDGGLFFTDYSRECIWFMKRGANGLPDPAQVSRFATDIPGPVDLRVGPGGDLFYVNFDGGTVGRIRYTAANQAPTAVARATPDSGPTPLTVSFDGRESSDPEGGTLAFAWDLDDDGQYDDSTSPQPTFTYTQARQYTVRLRVTDTQGREGTTSVLVTAGSNTAPVPTIEAPTATARWAVGDRIAFSGSATDQQDGTLPASALSWELIMRHCPGSCHSHPLQSFPGVAGGEFDAPDHDYPSHLELRLTATDADGARTTTTLELQPKTVDLTFQASTPGLELVAGSASTATPFTRTVIVGSSNSISAPTPQTLGAARYTFTSWSDGGAQSHNIVAPAAPATYTAAFEERPIPPVAAYSFDAGSGSSLADVSGGAHNGTITGAAWSAAGRVGSALSFDGVDDMVRIPDADALDLTTGMTLEAWVKPTAIGGWRTVLMKANGGTLSYAQYGNDGATRPNVEAHIGGDVRRARGTAALAVDTWTHLASTYDGTTLHLYVDGALVASTPFSGAIATSTGELTIGGNAIWSEWFSGLIDEVRVYDRALSVAEIQRDMTTPVGTPDTEDPGTPANLTATGRRGAIDLTWSAASDNVGVRHYNVHRSTSAGFTPTAANRIAQPAGTTFTDSGLAAGTYHYVVSAEDAAGNVGEPSTAASATATADTAAPSVTLTAPQAGARVSGTVTLSADAADDDAVSGVQFRVDGNDIGAQDTAAPYSLQWDSRSLGNGEHDLTAVARDAAGNARTSDAVRVTVDNPAQPPSPGLVAAYGFDEGGGTAVADISGKGNGGTVVGATWTPTGRFGSALAFDGVNDRVTVPDAASLDLTSGLTLEAWVRPAAASGWRTAIAKEHGTSIAYGLYANRNTNVPAAELHLGGRLRAVNGTTQLPAGAWSHVAATYDQASLRLFVNGTQVAVLARNEAIATSTGPLSIGGNAPFGEWFSGLIDEIRVYDRPLTAAEIQADMARAVGVPDTAAPTAPGNLEATGGLGSVGLTWSAANDNVGVHHYNVHRSTAAGFTPTPGNRIAQPSGLSYADQGLAAGTYHYVVTAADAAGNVSPASAERSATATADTTAPTVAVTAPAVGATVSGGVTLTADASDDDAVASVQFQIDGTDVGTPDTAAPYSMSWDSRSVANGAHDVTAVARDRSGNPRTSAAVRVTVENTAQPPSPGLVAAYGFDENSGTAASDASGTGNHGAVDGATWTAAGRFGSALSFDGVNDRVNVPDSGSLDLTTGMTLEAWVRPTAAGGVWRTAIAKNATGTVSYTLYANRNTNVTNTEVYIGGRLRAANGTAQLPVNTWSHLASTYDGTTLRLYVNGTQVAATAYAGSITVSTGVLSIGGNAIWSEWFAGQIDEVRVYNRALTAAQIQSDSTSPVT